MLSQLPDHTKLCFIVIQNIFNVKKFNVKLCFGLTLCQNKDKSVTLTHRPDVCLMTELQVKQQRFSGFSQVSCVWRIVTPTDKVSHHSEPPCLSVTYLSCHVIFIRPSKFHHISCESDGHLGWSCFICVPGQRRAKTQNHLVQDRQEGQQPAI